MLVNMFCIPSDINERNNNLRVRERQTTFYRMFKGEIAFENQLTILTEHICFTGAVPQILFFKT